MTRVLYGKRRSLESPDCRAQNGSRMRRVANGLVMGFRGNKRHSAREAWNATVRASQRMHLRGATGASNSVIA
jgi:hypothetical protein